MTYHRYLHEKTTFPRPKNSGDMYLSPVHGAGQVTTYEPTSTSWLTEVQYHSGARDTTALPVVWIAYVSSWFIAFATCTSR